MRVSVIVPAKNAEKTIDRLLTSLVNQTVYPYEIIVVDDGSTDRTSEVVRKYRGVKLISNKTSRGANFSRNRGIKHSNGDILAFIDSDCEAKPDWIESIIKLLSRKDVGAVSGSVYSGNIESLLSRYLESSIISPAPKYSHDIILERDFNFGVIVTTANFAVKKSVAEKVGLFDPDYRHFGSDDMDYAYRILRSGHKILCSPHLKVFHHHRVKLSKIIGRYFQYGEGFAIFKAKNPESKFATLTAILLYSLLLTLLIPVFSTIFYIQTEWPILRIFSYLFLLPVFAVSVHHFIKLAKDKIIERLLYIPLDLIMLYSSLFGFLYMRIKSFFGRKYLLVNLQ